VSDELDEALALLVRIGKGDLYFTEDGVGVMRCMMCKKCGHVLPASDIETCRHPNRLFSELDDHES